VTDGTVLANVCITVLTIAAFVLSATGLLFVRRDAAAAVARMDNDRTVRERLRVQLRRDLDAAVTDEDREAALQRWRDDHAAADVEPHTYQTVETGREVLAERIIRELSAGSRTDLVLVGLGLLCGLAAGLWSIWLP
jgi:hypothetical protein